MKMRNSINSQNSQIYEITKSGNSIQEFKIVKLKLKSKTRNSIEIKT